jgi:hypothetical protein
VAGTHAVALWQFPQTLVDWMWVALLPVAVAPS